MAGGTQIPLEGTDGLLRSCPHQPGIRQYASQMPPECVGSGPFLTASPHLLQNPRLSPLVPGQGMAPGTPGLPEFACAPFLTGPQVILVDRLLRITPRTPHVTRGWCCVLRQRFLGWLKGPLWVALSTSFLPVLL